MGREAYLTRLALGRSAYEPPEDGPYFNASQAGPWTSAFVPPNQTAAQAGYSSSDERPPQGVQLYNARGHPFNPWSRAQSRYSIAAMNDVLSVVGVVQRNLPDMLEELDGRYYPTTKMSSEEENIIGDWVGPVADIDNQFMSWWIHALTNRLLVFPPPSESSLMEVFKTHYDGMGFMRFFFAGLPAFLFSSFVNPELWTYHVAYRIDRAVYANVSSKRNRDFYAEVRPYLIGSIEVLLNVFVLPFRLHSMLQLLGLVPASQLLPSPRSWIPFCGTSVIRFHRDHLSLLPFFAFRPISSLVHHYFYLSCRPAIMEPVNPLQRRRSSGSRLPTSVNSVHLVELPNVETALTGVFRRIFKLFGWSHVTQASEASQSHPWRPVLSRRETWNMTDRSEAVGAQTTDGFHVPTAPVSRRRHSSLAQPAPEEQPSRDVLPQIHERSPSSSNGHAINADNGADATPDNTIRISYIDPETGAVNLEIGFPESGPGRHETNRDQNRGVERIAEDGPVRGNHVESSRRVSSTALSRRPHRISKLALEPTDMLANLVNSWVAGWVLMPFRAYVLRNLVNLVLNRPEIFGVSRSLPPQIGLQVGTRGIGQYAGKLALCCAVDVCLGLTFWFGEWMIVRSVGVEFFDWGDL